ncbi:GSCOCG00011984001-RA-CDS, partial [Cotesia congregata]
LVWKISPKTLWRSSTVVEIAAYVAACLVNEGSHSLLLIMNSLRIDCGSNSHRYTENRNSERIDLANRRANEDTREGRMHQRQHQLDVLEVSKSAEALLYGPGIDDSILISK